MQSSDPQETNPTRPVPSSLTEPAERTRNFSADDLEADVGDLKLDLTFDDENRLEDDANPGRD